MTTLLQSLLYIYIYIYLPVLINQSLNWDTTFLFFLSYYVWNDCDLIYKQFHSITSDTRSIITCTLEIWKWKFWLKSHSEFSSHFSNCLLVTFYKNLVVHKLNEMIWLKLGVNDARVFNARMTMIWSVFVAHLWDSLFFFLFSHARWSSDLILSVIPDYATCA